MLNHYAVASGALPSGPMKSTRSRWLRGIRRVAARQPAHARAPYPQRPDIPAPVPHRRQALCTLRGPSDLGRSTGSRRVSARATATAPAEPPLRTCIDCGEAKELGAFLQSRACVDGFTARCRSCIWLMSAREREAREARRATAR